MDKVLFFAVSLMAVTGIYCFPPFFPFGSIFPPFDEPHFPEVPRPNAQMLLDKYNKSGCLKEETGGKCPFNLTYVVYQHDINGCVTFIYGGCINNKNRIYTAKECNGKCVLSPSKGTATTNGESETTNPTTLTSSTASVSTPVASTYMETTSATPTTTTS